MYKALILLLLVSSSCRISKEKCEKVCRHTNEVLFRALANSLLDGTVLPDGTVRSGQPPDEDASKTDNAPSKTDNDPSKTGNDPSRIGEGQEKVLSYLLADDFFRKNAGKAPSKEITDQHIARALKGWLVTEDVTQRQLPLCIESCHKQGKRSEVDCYMAAKTPKAIKDCSH